MLALSCAMSVAEVRSQPKTLVVKRKASQTGAIRASVRTYGDRESLVGVTSGSLASQGNKGTLTLPAFCAKPSDTDLQESHRAVPTGLSSDLRKAANAALARTRAWASTIANAIQYGYVITESWAPSNREKLATCLRLASTNASTDSDRMRWRRLRMSARAGNVE